MHCPFTLNSEPKCGLIFFFFPKSCDFCMTGSRCSQLSGLVDRYLIMFCPSQDIFNCTLAKDFCSWTNTLFVPEFISAILRWPIQSNHLKSLHILQSHNFYIIQWSIYFLCAQFNTSAMNEVLLLIWNSFLSKNGVHALVSFFRRGVFLKPPCGLRLPAPPADVRTSACKIHAANLSVQNTRSDLSVQNTRCEPQRAKYTLLQKWTASEKELKMALSYQILHIRLYSSQKTVPEPIFIEFTGNGA